MLSLTPSETWELQLIRKLKYDPKYFSVIDLVFNVYAQNEGKIQARRKWLALFEKILKNNNGGQGFLVGNDVSPHPLLCTRSEIDLLIL